MAIQLNLMNPIKKLKTTFLISLFSITLLGCQATKQAQYDAEVLPLQEQYNLMRNDFEDQESLVKKEKKSRYVLKNKKESERSDKLITLERRSKSLKTEYRKKNADYEKNLLTISVKGEFDSSYYIANKHYTKFNSLGIVINQEEEILLLKDKRIPLDGEHYFLVKSQKKKNVQTVLGSNKFISVYKINFVETKKFNNLKAEYDKKRSDNYKLYVKTEKENIKLRKAHFDYPPYDEAVEKRESLKGEVKELVDEISEVNYKYGKPTSTLPYW